MVIKDARQTLRLSPRKEREAFARRAQVPIRLAALAQGGLSTAKRRRLGMTSIYCSLAYSALASFRIGMSGSASFQRAKKF